MTINPSHWVPHEPTVELTKSSDLEASPDVAFELALAPDGLPLALHVRRAVDVRSPVASALGRPETLPREIERALTDLERATRVHTVDKGIERVERKLYYETSASIASLLDDTLLSRMLGAVSPMVLPEDKARAMSTSTPDRFNSTMMCSIREIEAADNDAPVAAVEPPPTFGKDARLWVGISRPAVLAVPHKASKTDRLDARFAAGRPVKFESLLALRSARWHTITRTYNNLDGPPADGRLADQSAYIDAIRNAKRVGWSVSRADVAMLVAELARSVDRDWHARERVHCDLKPGNTLLTQTGIEAFDSLDVKIGDPTAGVTEGWAAPEQIFVRPVSPATDVYALGLMMVSTLGAAIYGEEQSVVVPAAGAGRRRLRMMKDPEVYLDPSTLALDLKARVAWRGLLIECLASDPRRRPQRGGELANRLDELLAKWELPGRIEVACGPGSLQLTVGRRHPMWVMSDSR